MSESVGRPAIHLSSILRRATAQHPWREALVWGERRLAYADLTTDCDRIAAALATAGVAPGDRVAILGRNEIGIATALLALSRHGHPAVPLNWRLSDHALAATAARYRPAAVLHSEPFTAAAAALAAALPGDVAALCVTDPAALSGAGQPPPVEPTRDGVFAYISTGGTEGVPKGVPVTNAMVEAAVIAQIASEPIADDDVTLILPQMFHNPHLYVIPPLLAGGKLVVPDMASFDAELVLRTIERERVTRFLGVATMMAYLLDAQKRVGADVSSLRTISYGGAPFAARTVRQLVETFDCGLLQLYGQTEASVLISTLTPADHRRAIDDPSHEHLLASAGRPVPLVEVRVVGDDGTLCPRDRATVGEIQYRSPSAMTGYFEDPERTAEAFAGDWLRSGDLATWDEDDYLYIVDRRGDMIISGGENVYPSAIEDVVRELPGVADVVVIGVPEETWGEVVTAVVATEPGATVDAAAIDARCAERLARYMRPRTVHLVDELPQNASGKVMRGEVKRRYGSPSDTLGRL